MVTSSCIVIVGPFPPPVYGFATTNAAVCAHLRALGARPETIDTASKSLNRSLASRLGRLPRVARSYIQLAVARRPAGGTFYMGVSGGWGQIYDLVFIAIARLRRMHVFLRHASFAYLDRPTVTARLLVRLAGKSAIHVTQSPRMAELLNTLYGAVHVVPISNAVLYPRDAGQPVVFRPALRTIAFFSNISADKGIFDFLDLMAALAQSRRAIRARIAGSFEDAETERAVRARLTNLPNVAYVGPVYGQAKADFLANIDLLVFPTRYRNETEAKVNHEAMSRGIPVIAYGRGCIPEILDSSCGEVVDPSTAFVPPALARIQGWLDDSSAFAESSRRAARRFERTYAASETRWRRLLKDLMTPGQADHATSSKTHPSER